MAIPAVWYMFSAMVVMFFPSFFTVSNGTGTQHVPSDVNSLCTPLQNATNCISVFEISRFSQNQKDLFSYFTKENRCFRLFS
jgi:hypothetical protein